MTRQYVTLEDVLRDVQPGFASGERDLSGVLQIRMNNVTTDGELVWNNTTRVPATTRQVAKLSLAGGDVLFNITNSPELVGKATLFTGGAEPVVFSNHFLRLRTGETKLLPAYLARFLTYKQKQGVFQQIATQWVNQATVRREDLLQLRLALPDLEHQHRIVAQLDKADRLRRTRRYAQTLSDTFLQSVFLEMFGDPVTNPKGWDALPLQELIDGERPVTYGILKPGPDIEGGVPYVRVVDIMDGRIHIAGIRRTTTAIAQEYRRSTLSPGDLLISIRGHVGRMAVVPASLNGANITQDTARLAPNKLTNAHFLMGCLTQGSMKARMGDLTRGAAVQGINLGDLRELPIPVPPEELRSRYAVVASDFIRLRHQQQEAARQADHLFHSLLHRAFQTEK